MAAATKKVKYYSLSSVSDKILADTKEINPKEFYIDENFVLIEGKKKSIYSVEYEGVHNIVGPRKNIVLGVFPRLEKGHVALFPKFRVTLTLKELLAYEPPFKEIELCQAVRTFGARLDVNYNLLLKSCEEIGLDLSEYDTDRNSKKDVVQ